MKKLLGILVLGLMWCNVAYALDYRATCDDGLCVFSLNMWYPYAETNCMQKLVNEKVIVTFMYFEIVETGQRCIVFNQGEF